MGVKAKTAQTAAKHWYLVTIVDDDEKALGSVFWGIIVEDKKRRFQPGNYVCSSLVIEELGDSLFQTKNTTYEGIGEGSRVILHIKHFENLMRGFSPDEIETINAMPGYKLVL